MKNILLAFIFLIFGMNCLAGNSEDKYASSVSMFNRLKNGNELIKLVLAADKKTTTEDKKFLEELKFSIGNEKVLKAKLSGNSILLDGNKIKIDITNSALGEYTINGKPIKLSPNKPLKVMFKEIQNALDSKYSKYEFFFMNRAQAVGPIVAAVASVYGVGVVVTATGCAVVANRIMYWKKINDTESIQKAVTKCADVSIKWPYYAWKFYDSIANGNDIKEGSCVKGSGTNKFGDLVHLKLNNDLKSEVYLNASVKNSSVGLFENGYDSKNQTYDQIHEIYSEHRWLYIGDDKNKAIGFVEKLQAACAAGGTEALNKLISSDSSIKKGLTKLAEEAGKARREAAEKPPVVIDQQTSGTKQ